MATILKLTVTKQWFALYRSNEKKEEFRKPGKWIESRLLNKEYDFVQFTNGYGKNRPCIMLEYKGYNKNSLIRHTQKYSDGSEVSVDIGDYIIYSGKIVYFYE